MALKVVFDTNIYLSAIIFGGSPRLCLEAARERIIELYTSRTLLLELARVLGEKFDWSSSEIAGFIKGIGYFARIVTVERTISIIKSDVSDNMVLEAAIAAKADFIISGDKKHLLSLKEFEGIKIISATYFVKAIHFLTRL
jgi:putative PIN family toxin of toxin-antitoxin system